MDRLISEQAVLDVINEANRIGRFYCGKERTINEIKAIPSAEPKIGHLILYNVHGHDACKCSECGEDLGYPCRDKYCKHCGVKIQEVEE